MAKRIKFKFKELEEVGKVLVWVDYIDREFFNEDYADKWEYDGIYFNIFTYIETKKGNLEIRQCENGIYEFSLRLGVEESIFVINKNEVKIFKDLENKVYSNSEKILSEYLYKENAKNKKYYFIDFTCKKLEFSINSCKLDFDSVDKNLFKIGNMFNSKKEAEKIRR